MSMDAPVVMYDVTLDLTPREVAVVAPAPSVEKIRQAQNILAEMPQTPLDEPIHEFSAGMYVRTLIIPADTVVVGAQHRHEHPVFLLRGECTILTNSGMERITAPHRWISPAGAKRILTTHTECEFTTVHLNPEDSRDIVALEDEIMVPEPGVKTRNLLGSTRLLAATDERGAFHDELQGVFA